MIGNDVVDLSDPDSSSGARHSRFDRRVFAPNELEALSWVAADSERRWILWSAKEAAYKAARRESGDVVFSPARFVVELDRSMRGTVTVGDRRWCARVRVGGGCVHAIVSGDESLSTALSGVRRLSAKELCDPSGAARRYAIASIAAELGVASSELSIQKRSRIPNLVVSGEVDTLPLSLSHHGSYVAFACSDPRFAQTDRFHEKGRVDENAQAVLHFGIDRAVLSSACRLHTQQSGHL